MITVRVTIDANNFETYLDERILRLSDAGMTAMLSGEVFPFLSERVSNRFDSGGDSASGAWDAISPITLANRQVNLSPDPLIDTGTLRSWAENPGGSRGASAGGVAFLDYPAVAPTDSITNYKYLMAQFGINNTFGVAGLYTPDRPIFAADAVDLSGIMTILLLHIMQ